MFAIIDHYAGKDGPLHRWHPVVKLLALIASMVVIVSLHHFGPLFLGIAGSWLLAMASGVPARLTLRRQRIAVILAVVMFAAAWAFTEGGPFWQLGPLRVPIQPARSAGLLALKLSAILTLSIPLLATQPFYVFLASLRRMGVPDKMISMLHLMYRYNVVFADRMQSTLRAAWLRGWRLSVNPVRLQPLGGMFGSLVLRSLEQAERVEQAMRLRGFDGRIHVTWRYKLRAMDLLKAAGALGWAAGMLGWDLWM